MDKVKGFQPKGNPWLGIVIPPTEILTPIIWPEEPYVNEKFDSSTLDIGILDMT